MACVLFSCSWSFILFFVIEYVKQGQQKCRGKGEKKFSVNSPLETRDQGKEKEKPQMMFPGEKEVLWDFKESCHMKSRGETVKWNLSVLGFRCVLCRCAPAGPSHRPLEILPFQGWRALGGAATCPILLPSLGRGNVCDVGFPLQKQWAFVPKQEISVIVLYHHLSAVEKTGFKVTSPKLGERLWFAQCFVHKGYCRSDLHSHTIGVAVRGAHEKDEAMEIEQAFTLGFFPPLFICHICVWSSQCLTHGPKQSLSPGITGSGGKTQIKKHFPKQATVRRQSCASAVRS